MDTRAALEALRRMTESKPVSNSATYNTAAAPADEAGYGEWLGAQSKALGRDLASDEEDYDLRGLYLKTGGAPLAAGHFTDEFKKPNHPTFSAESKWNGANGREGGEWVQTPKGWEFRASPWNVQNMGLDRLRAYFSRVEPGVPLIAPGGK